MRRRPYTEKGKADVGGGTLARDKGARRVQKVDFVRIRKILCGCSQIGISVVNVEIERGRGIKRISRESNGCARGLCDVGLFDNACLIETGNDTAGDLA